jgi:hypothetical protein
MPEMTYFPEVRCEVQEGGLMPNGVTVILADVNGRRQFIQVTRGLINRHGDADYLAVGFVDIDRRTRRVLIEFPAEADSGANRMWVGFDSLRKEVATGTGAVA